MIDIIKRSECLLTSREQIRAGFIAFALGKNCHSTPIIESAESFKMFASRPKTANR
jgi:hypothetical protein